MEDERKLLLLRLNRLRKFIEIAPKDDLRLEFANKLMAFLACERSTLQQALWVFQAATSKPLDDQRLAFLQRAIRIAMSESCSIVEDGLATIANAVWLQDPRFNEAYEAGRGISVWGHDIRYRAYVLMKCAERAASLEGDFVECGVDRGGTARSVIEFLGKAVFAKRKFYLFDTFSGLVAEQLSDEEKQATRITKERYPDVLEEVRRNFADCDFTRIVPGAVPDTLSQFEGKRVAYLHIDMNVAMPECAALETFWPLLSPGAPVIFDDYGFPFHNQQRVALDTVAKKLGTSIIMLPTCQGLLWRT